MPQVQPDPVFRMLLVQARKRQLAKGRGKAPYPRPPARKYPTLLERKYAAYLIWLLAPMAKISNEWARTQYAQALAAYRKDESDLHQDADSLELTLSLTDPMKQAQIDMGLEFGGTAAAQILSYGSAVNAHVAKQFALERQIALGNVYDIQEPWVQDALAEWTETNRRLVKSLTSESITRMESMVVEAVQTGQRPDQIIPRIYNLNRSTGLARARLIARDQIGKLIGLLTEKRSLAIGMDTYTWQTAMDERVRGNPAGRYPTARPSHWAAQGKVGVFGDPTVWIVNGKNVPRSGVVPNAAPGMEIQCRCLAGGRWEDVLKPIDEELLADPYALAEMGLGPWPS